MTFYPNEVKRYNLWAKEMVEASDGKWVKFEDHERLYALYESLALKDSAKIMQSMDNSINKKSRISAIRKKLDEK